MRHRFVFVVLLNLLLLLSIPFSNAQDERLQIVGSHSILSDVIANVAGDVADVTSVMPRGADPHSFIPSPSDLTALADADVVFINGAFFEEGLLEAIENASDGLNIVTASACVEIIAFGGHDDHGHDEHGDEDHEHGDEDHAHEEGEDHEHGDEEHAHEEDDDHEHGDEEHAHEEDDDHDHGDEEHSEMGDMSAMAMLCEQHYAEMEALHADSHDHGDEDHAHEEGEDHEHGDEDHAHEEGEDHEHSDEDHEHEEGEDHEHGDEDHAHEEGEDHDHDHAHEEGKVETLGALYQADCGEGHGHAHEEEGEHEEGEEHDDEHGHDDHGHDHGACDPHVWMEPHNVMYWTMLIRDTLIELDPANAETYTANAAAYLEAVDELAHDFVMPLIETLPEENRVLITNHDAFGYFVARYDFEVSSTIIPSLSTLAQASAADVAATIDLIREQNVPAIFAETTVSDDLVQQIADETGVQFYTLYTGSLSDADGPASTYIDYIRYNVTTIVEALGGGM